MPDQISTETSWPTWKVALVVGIPAVVVGVGGYCYYSSSRSPKTDKEPSTSDKSKSKSLRVEPEGSSSPQNIQAVKKQSTTKDPEPPKAVTKLQEAQVLKNSGNRLFKEGHYQEAIDKYSEAIIACPDDKKMEKSTYHQNKAAALEKLQDWTGVIEECSLAIELNQKYVKALYRRAKAYQRMQQYENSLEDYTTVCILEGFENHNTMLQADGVLKQIGEDRAAAKYTNRTPVMPSGLFVKQYFASFNDDLISKPLTDEMKALSASSGYVRAKILLEKADYDDIMRECTHEIEASKEAGEKAEADKEDHPNFSTEALLLRGTFHLLTGNSKDALLDLNEVIDTKDANAKLRANALIKRGSMFMQQQDTTKAKADFTLASDVDPENCDVYHHRGQLNILMDKAEAAIADFDKCISLKPDFAMAHAQKCYTEYRKAFGVNDYREIERTIVEFESIIQKYPNCSETYGLFAQARTDKRNYPGADELFQKAIKIEPDNATLYVHRGLLALQWKQDFDRAVELINKALEIDEKCDFAHETMGTIEVQRGNLEKAKKHFDISIEFAKTELELAHLYTLQAAAVAQANIAAKYGLKPSIPSLSGF